MSTDPVRRICARSTNFSTGPKSLPRRSNRTIPKNGYFLCTSHIKLTVCNLKTIIAVSFKKVSDGCPRSPPVPGDPQNEMAADDSEQQQQQQSTDGGQVQLLKQGAEGKLYIGQHGGVRCLVKERFSKKYRHPDLDVQLTRQRIKAEQKAFERCKAAGVDTPKLLGVDLAGRKIYMEYLETAKTAKELVDETVLGGGGGKDVIGRLAAEIGRVVGTLHGHNIIHGDLTTSNILLDPVEGGEVPYRLVMIDFGLSYHSMNVEDMGVDLYVLERALLSAHSEVPEFFELVLDSYKKHNKFKLAETIAKYEEVRARGRKRTMIG